MGTYLNPRPNLWQESLNSEIYVDKTGLINYINSVINTKQKYICVSRPRRFGKTTAMDMMAAYYNCNTDARELFEGLEIASAGDFEKHANKYNVLRINALELFRKSKKVLEGLERLNRVIIKDMKKTLPEVDFEEVEDLVDGCQEIYNTTDRQFIILIDEWDCVFRENKFDTEGQKLYLDFLREWLKDREYVALAYMTGILPIKKYGKHSSLNMFREFSMENQRDLEEYTGFTAADVQKLCTQYNMDYAHCKAWYDGYMLRRVKEVYNPLSVVEAMLSGVYANYWTKTESFEALKIYIDMNYDGLKENILKLMAGNRQKIDTSNFSNDMVTFEDADDVMTLLIHLGYLGYDSELREAFIPNNEIRVEFAAAVKNSKSNVEVAKAIKNADDLLEATLAGDSDKVAELVQNAHLETSYLQYNDENALSYTVSLAYYSARSKYNIRREMPAGKGFADMVFTPLPHHPEMPPMVVELKWDKTADTAIKQIKEKNYPECLKGYEGKILLVGINYNKTTKEHTCVIEKA